MTKTDTGGYAFPSKDEDRYGPLYFRGMTLRDWFAGMALQGILANEMCFSEVEQVVEQAYKTADAMIEKRAAREKDDK